MTARTPSAAAALPFARRSGRVLTATVALLLGGVVLAAPAAAVDDPAKPDALVTHGPSCHPGGVVVEVTGGAVDYDVTFATTRSPGGEDSARVRAGETVVLRTGDVAWGETIDGRLEYVPAEGSRGAFVDELEGYTFTRPAEEDCAAVTAPAAAATVPRAEPDADVAIAPEPAGDEEPVVAGADVRPDGTRPGGTDAADGPADPSPVGSAELPGKAAPVDFVEASATDAPVQAPPAPAPMVAAAVALVAATAGVAGVLGRSRRLGRRPTGSA